ncbi:MAG: ribosomal RNA small subunit methyltransferase A [Planctomycetes bacterium]|nr:ribosomal RNA small subunit methyltransferase A [Planctomycetota bacterium]
MIRRRREARPAPGRAVEREAGGGPAAGSGGVLSRLREAGLLPRKALGQHFLHDPRLLAALAEEAGVTAEDRVLEVGTGPGTLTRELALRAASVLTVEVDPRMVDFAREELRGLQNVAFHVGDVLERPGRLSRAVVDLLRPLEPFLWVSNLPYGIATTLIVRICESGLAWRRASLLIQSEVAERIVAAPGSGAYGPLSLLVAYWARPRLGRKVPAGAFWPPPEVASRVLHLERSEPMGPRALYAPYRAWVQSLFQARRKQVGGLFRKALGPEGASRALAATGWSPSTRPEDLGPADFLRLAGLYPGFSH